eukprot:11152286-Lingulodinium_polyedra.AAC.1
MQHHAKPSVRSPCSCVRMQPACVCFVHALPHPTATIASPHSGAILGCAAWQPRDALAAPLPSCTLLHDGGR